MSFDIGGKGMSKIRLFNIEGNRTTEVKGNSVRLERELQVLMESNLEELLGVRFLETEYSTGTQHGGRIDTLGLDGDNCPVIIEYKRHSNESVINQGFYYLSWLLDHKAEYEKLVEERLGAEVARNIEWDHPRIICVAGGFNKFDIHTADVLSSSSNIDLVRYIRYDNHLLLEKVHSSEINIKSKKTFVPDKGRVVTTVVEHAGESDKAVIRDFNKMTDEVKELYKELEDYIFGLGDDVVKRTHQRYMAYSRFGNFMTLLFQKNRIVLYLFLEPETIEFTENMRDMSVRDNHRIGDVRFDITSREELERGFNLVERAYQG